jgi:hypothetical protein
MSKILPLERIRKVYKDKSNNLSKFSYGSIHKRQMEDEKKDNELLSNPECEVTAEELKAKRDQKYQNAYLGTFTGPNLEKLRDHQYRVRKGSNKNFEIDSM